MEVPLVVDEDGPGTDDEGSRAVGEFVDRGEAEVDAIETRRAREVVSAERAVVRLAQSTLPKKTRYAHSARAGMTA